MTPVTPRNRWEILAPREEGYRHLAFAGSPTAALRVAAEWDARWRRRGRFYGRCTARDRMTGIEARAAPYSPRGTSAGRALRRDFGPDPDE